MVQKSPPSSNLGVVALGYDVGKISAGCLVARQAYKLQIDEKYQSRGKLLSISRNFQQNFDTGYSYIVSLPKSSDSISKAMTCKNFRLIAISPIISKLFEYCFIDKFDEFFSTDNKQFDFEKGMGCNHAIYTVRQVVEGVTRSTCPAQILVKHSTK